MEEASGFPLSLGVTLLCFTSLASSWVLMILVSCTKTSVCVCVCVCVCVLVAQSCLTLCNPIDCSSPGSSVHGILQARILEWVAFPFSRGSSQPRDQSWGSSQPRDQSWVSSGLCRGDSLHCRQILYCLSHREALPKLLLLKLRNFRIKTLNFKNHGCWQP